MKNVNRELGFVNNNNNNKNLKLAGTTTTNKQQTLTAASCLACVHNQIDETPLKHNIEYCVKRVEVKPAAGRPASISSGDHAKLSDDKDKENSPADTSTSNTSVDGQTSQQLSKNAKKKKRKKNNKAAAAAAVMAATATSLSATSLAPDEAQNDNAHNNSCLLYTSPSPRDQRGSRMPSSA